LVFITIPKALRDRLGEEATEAFTEVVKALDLEARKEALVLAEERFEKRLTEEIGKVNERLTEEIGKVNERLTEEIGKVRLDLEKLRTEMQLLKADLLKWVFVAWLSQIGVLSGIMLAFLKYVR